MTKKTFLLWKSLVTCVCLFLPSFFFREGEKEREGKNYKNKFQFHLVAFEAFYKCS